MPISWAIAKAAAATPNVTRKNPTKRTAPIVPGPIVERWARATPARLLPRHSGLCHAEFLSGRRDSGTPGAPCTRRVDVSEGRRRVTGSRRQSRRRGASVTVAVPPMRCTRAGPRVRGRLGVLAGRSGSTCDASVSARGPCSQRRRLGWMWRYPLVKKATGPSPAGRARRGPGRGGPSSNVVG